jgi:hypothetical protein
LIQQNIPANIFGSVANNRDIGQTQFSNLIVQPSRASFHGFNQHKLDVWAGNSEHQAGKSSSATHVSHTTVEEGCNNAAIKNVA